MTTLRRCPVCRSTVNSSDSTHCPACGVVLDHGHSAAENIAVDDIIKKVKQQMSSLDDAVDAHHPGTGSVDGRDIAEILSDAAFQSILHESRGNDEASPVEDSPSASGMPVGREDISADAYPGQPDTGFDNAGEERSAPFRTVLGSSRQARMNDELHDEEEISFDAAQEFDPPMVNKDSQFAERPYPGRPEQVQPRAPKKRTWWGLTRQTLWLLLVLLLCIVFFRIFGPEKKEPTFEDFFRPGNPDIKFLDAIEFLEKYYERHPEKRYGNVGIQADEVSDESMQSPQPVDSPDEKYSRQTPDKSTLRNPSSSPVFSGPTP